MPERLNSRQESRAGCDLSFRLTGREGELSCYANERFGSMPSETVSSKGAKMKGSKLFVGLIFGLSVLAFSCQSVPPAAPAAAAEPAAKPAEPAKPVGKTLNVHMGTPTIDGDMDDAYNATDAIKAEVVSLGKTPDSLEARLLWDAGFLYVFASVKDPVLSAANANAWEQDSVEFFIDQANTKATSYKAGCAQIRVNYKNAVSGSSGVSASKYKSVAKVVDGGYNVEIAIPLDKVPGAEGNLMGFDLQLNDDNGAGHRTGIIAWNDSSNTDYQNPSKFGTITLVK
jgi:Carbohydrate family 9 binding domain-like